MRKTEPKYCFSSKDNEHFGVALKDKCINKHAKKKLNNHFERSSLRERGRGRTV